MAEEWELDHSWKAIRDKQSDQDRLLPGEDPESPWTDDARHWMNAYRELVRFKHGLLRSTRAERDRIDPRARPEVDLDLHALELEAERLADRLAFWSRRVRELEAAEGRS